MFAQAHDVTPIFLKNCRKEELEYATIPKFVAKNMKDISNINSSSGGMLTNGTSSNGRSHLENCLVVDLGTATTKSGWSNRSEPDMSIPSIVGHGRHKGAMATLGLSDSYVGRQAQTLQGILNIRQPFKQGCVQHWDDLELLWDHTWKQELKRMRVSFETML